MGDWNRIFVSIRDREGITFIQSLLDAGLDVNALILNNNHTTMLSCAAAYGNLEIVEFLLQRGADCNVTNFDGSKPLHDAAANGRADIVKLFLNLGVFVDSRDNSNSTPLHYVARNSPVMDREVVHILINNHADFDAVNQKRRTPLLTAARNYCWGLVKLFIDLGANVKCCDGGAWTVLHYSCCNGWTDIVYSLVDGRLDSVDLNVRNFDGNTPLSIAAESLHKDIVKLLIKSGADVKSHNFLRKTVLHYVCEAGWLDVVTSVINKGCDLDGKDFQGNTPLAIAIDKSHGEVAKLLVNSGANVECNGLENLTLLHSACESGRLNVLKLLLNKGWDMNAKNSRGETPVLLAAFYSHSSVVGYLVESGVDVECRSNDGRTVLHFACREGWPDIVKSLILKGFDLNARNGNSDTFLHLAIRSGNLETIELLLKAGADCNVKNYNGKTAFNDFVQKLRTLNGIVLFIENGAYFQYDDYVAISEVPLFKEGILQNVKLCTQAVINKFNNAELPRVYKIPGVSESLPSIERLKIAANTKVACHIAQAVEYEIETKGYCDVLNVRPIALSILIARFLVEHYDS